MKKMLIIFLLIEVITFGQVVDKGFIKSSNMYYWGESVAETEKEAYDMALAQLIQNIAVTVTSEFQKNIIENNRKIEENVTSILNTYSLATIKDVKTIKTPLKGKIEVFNYLEKSEIKKIFDSRKKLIYDIYKKAEEFENETNLGYALKWYYFAIILMNSIPENIIEYDGKNLITEIPARISKIINDVTFTVKKDLKKSDKEREIILKIDYNSKPVQQIEFNYWDGTAQSTVRGIDGEGVVNLLGSSVKFDKLSIDIKYSYYESRNEIKEVGDLWNLVKKPSFVLTKVINLSSTNELVDKKLFKDTTLEKEEKFDKFIVKEYGDIKLIVDNPDSCKVIDKIINEVTKFVSLLKNGNINELISSYKNDSYLSSKLRRIFKYNAPSYLNDNEIVTVKKTIDGWELRKIKVVNHYLTINEHTSEYFILDFNINGELIDVNYGLVDMVYSKVENIAKNYGKDWLNRQTILKFAEKYRTAFLSRDIETINSLFAEEALIIIGRLIKRSNRSEMYRYIKLNESQPDVEYIRYTKSEYIKRLMQLFNNIDDIYLGFSTFDITRKNVEHVYGISMRQNYHSTNYSDEGYLFLLVDFERKIPQIYVRTWQPGEWDEDALIKLSNFNINR